MAQRLKSLFQDGWTLAVIVVGLMSGITSIIREAIGIYLPGAVAPRRIFDLSLMVCFFVAMCVAVWRQRRRIDELQGTREQKRLVADGLAKLTPAERAVVRELATPRRMNNQEGVAFLRTAGFDAPVEPMQPMASIEKKTGWVRRDYPGYFFIDPPELRTVVRTLLD